MTEIITHLTGGVYYLVAGQKMRKALIRLRWLFRVGRMHNVGRLNISLIYGRNAWARCTADSVQKR